MKISTLDKLAILIFVLLMTGAFLFHLHPSSARKKYTQFENETGLYYNDASIIQ